MITSQQVFEIPDSAKHRGAHYLQKMWFLRPWHDSWIWDAYDQRFPRKHSSYVDLHTSTITHNRHTPTHTHVIGLTYTLVCAQKHTEISCTQTLCADARFKSWQRSCQLCRRSLQGKSWQRSCSAPLPALAASVATAGVGTAGARFISCLIHSVLCSVIALRISHPPANHPPSLCPRARHEMLHGLRR